MTKSGIENAKLLKFTVSLICFMYSLVNNEIKYGMYLIHTVMKLMY